MTSRIRLGLLTPSSNTVMEPRVGRLLSGLPHVTAHFGRFRVLRISMNSDALEQFNFDPQLAAADLLADARCDVIAWGGTSGGWLGVQHDRELCRKIRELTGIPATTTTLATLDGFRALKARTYALATPYLEEVQQAIRRNFCGLALECAAERHLGDPGNFSFATYDPPTVESLIREVAASAPDAISVFCTNFDGTEVAPMVERETGIPVLDSISVTIWHALRIAGVDTSPLADWGRIFDCALPASELRDSAPVPA